MLTPWRCPTPRRTIARRLLQIVQSGAAPISRRSTESILRHDGDLAWAAYPDANGMDVEARGRLVVELDGASRAVAGVGFVSTPSPRSAVLSARSASRTAAGVWVKDETGGVAGAIISPVAAQIDRRSAESVHDVRPAWLNRAPTWNRPTRRQGRRRRKSDPVLFVRFHPTGSAETDTVDVVVAGLVRDEVDGRV